MKNTLKILGIIAFIAVIGFPIVGCASLGGGGGGGNSSNEASLAAVPAGDVPANLVGRWYDDARKRRGDFVQEITADGKLIVDGGSISTLYADATHLWLSSNGVTSSLDGSVGQKTPYRLVGNSLFMTITAMGMTMETELFR